MILLEVRINESFSVTTFSDMSGACYKIIINNIWSNLYCAYLNFIFLLYEQLSDNGNFIKMVY